MNQRFGRYELLGELARGGMGAVYRARDLELGREVAIKVITTPLGPEALGRFKLEGEAAARVKHPNVLQVHERGVHQGRPYLVMDLAAGSLRERLRKGGALSGVEAAQILAPIADALGEVHAAQILHRDLKPENILIGHEGQPLLADFGIARAVDRETRYTQSGVLVGTPAYMAPEQAAGEDLDPRVDVYGLGAILYELVTGQPPFLGGTVLNVLNRVLSSPPLAPSQISPGLEPWVEALCLRCLEKDPQDRFANMTELAAALRSGVVPPRRTSPALVGGALVVLGLAGLGLALAWGVGAAATTPLPSEAPAAKETLSVRALGPVSREGRVELELSLSPAPQRSRRVERREGDQTDFVELSGERPTRITLRCERPGKTTWTFKLVGGQTEAQVEVECPALPAWYLALRERPPLLPGLTPAPLAEGDYINEVDDSVLRWIPPGEALMANAEFGGKTEVRAGFYLGKFEVTHAQYQAYLRWRGVRAGKGKPYHPMQVDFHGATRYARWAGARLPTIAEWNLAAFGPPERRRKFPWGEAKPNPDDHDIGRGPQAGGPRPVMRLKDMTPEGVIGMGGGVVEWVADANPVGDLARLGPDHSSPSQPAPQRPPTSPLLGREREVRGSSFGHDLLSAHARWHPARAAYQMKQFVDQGFRIVRSAKRPEPAHLEWLVRFRRFENAASFEREGAGGPSQFGPFLAGEVKTKLLRNPWQRALPRRTWDSFATFARAELELPAGSWVFSILHADDGVRLRVLDGEQVLSEVDAWRYQVSRHLEAVVRLEEKRALVVEVDHFELRGGEGLWVELSRE